MDSAPLCASLSSADCSSARAIEETVLKIARSRPTHPMNIVVFSESCSNPRGRLFAFDCVDSVRHLVQQTRPGVNLFFVIDNTWLSAAACNPFKYNVDFIVESTTKYCSGGNAIGGFILSSRESPVMAAVLFLSVKLSSYVNKGPLLALHKWNTCQSIACKNHTYSSFGTS